MSYFSWQKKKTQKFLTLIDVSSFSSTESFYVNKCRKFLCFFVMKNNLYVFTQFESHFSHLYLPYVQWLSKIKEITKKNKNLLVKILLLKAVWQLLKSKDSLFNSFSSPIMQNSHFTVCSPKIWNYNDTCQLSNLHLNHYQWFMKSRFDCCLVFTNICKKFQIYDKSPKGIKWSVIPLPCPVWCRPRSGLCSVDYSSEILSIHPSTHPSIHTPVA